MALGARFELCGNGINTEKEKDLADWTVCMHHCNAVMIYLIRG
jgi:hypothetical protein